MWPPTMANGGLNTHKRYGRFKPESRTEAVWDPPYNGNPSWQGYDAHVFKTAPLVQSGSLSSLLFRAQVLTLGLQVYKQYLLWALKYANMNYFGRFGAPGLSWSRLHAPSLWAVVILSSLVTLSCRHQAKGSKYPDSPYLPKAAMPSVYLSMYTYLHTYKDIVNKYVMYLNK